MITQASDKLKWGTGGERGPKAAAEALPLSASQIEDLRFAAAQMRGAARRAFQAEMTLKYCHGSARFAETVLGWSREAVEVGGAEPWGVARFRSGRQCKCRLSNRGCWCRSR